MELLFKAMKSHGHLDQLPSGKKCVVECLVWASVLTLLASQALYRAIRQLIEPDRAMPLLRWASTVASIASELLALIIRRDPSNERALRRYLVYNAPDPNRNRTDRELDPVLGIIPARAHSLAVTVFGG